jgi:ricin-type beta-trefoil lectin protein
MGTSRRVSRTRLVRIAGLAGIIVLLSGLLGQGVAVAGAQDSSALRDRAMAAVAAQPTETDVPKSTGVTPRKSGGPADMAPASAAAEGCDISFDKNIVEFPEGNGAVSVVVNFSGKLSCSFLSSYEYGAVSYLVDRDPATSGVPLGFGTEIYGTGTQTSVGVAGISSAYPGGQQVETVLYVELYVPGVPLECSSIPRPGVRVIDCAGEGTDYLVALLGSGSYDSKKRPGTTPPPPSKFNITAVHSGKCLDVEGASIADGANIHQWTCSPPGGTNQQWRLVQVSGNVYNIIAVHSGKCLDVEGAGMQDGDDVHQWTCTPPGGTNQQWRLVQVSGDIYNIIAVHSGKCLDVEGAGLQDGANIHQWTCTPPGGTNQQWRLIPIA